MRDPYETFKTTAAEMSAEGVSDDLICDALLCLGLNASCRIAGPEFTISYLHKMIAVFEAKVDGQTSPPIATQ